MSAPPRVQRGLLIAPHWIELILGGKKIWEMRKTRTHIREFIALIPIEGGRNGKVVGVVELVNSLPALPSREDVTTAEKYHCIGAQELTEFEDYRFPWVLKNPQRLTPSISLTLRNGHQTWVRFDPATSSEIEMRLAGLEGVAQAL